jgi:hypothetical protein
VNVFKNWKLAYTAVSFATFRGGEKIVESLFQPWKIRKRET